MREEGGSWRHENKYICTAVQLSIVESRIRPLLRPDPHAGEDGAYRIRSVYFDDEQDSGYQENEDGTDPREKFRIRIYDGDASHITLELKQKMRGMTRKLSCPLTREQCERALAGLPAGGAQDAPPLLRLFAAWQSQYRLTARVIVEYVRRPYVLPMGNVRITLDEDIESASRTALFLEGGYARRPVMPAGQHVLEVKYDAFLPDPVRQVLQLESLQRTSCSKYYLCRRYGLGPAGNASYHISYHAGAPGAGALDAAFLGNGGCGGKESAGLR